MHHSQRIPTCNHFYFAHFATSSFFFVFFTNQIFSEPAESFDSYGNSESEYEYLNDICCKQSHEAQSSSGEYAPLANLEGEPSAYVHGCVNVISGQFCEFQTDLTVHHGIDPIIVERSHAGNTKNSGPIGCGWYMNHHSALAYKTSVLPKNEKKNKRCMFEDNHGAFPLVFESDESGSNYRLISHLKGATNTTHRLISGQTNLRNMKYVDNAIPTIKNGDNSTREYYVPSSKDHYFSIKNEKKPTGNKWVYTHKRSDHSSRLTHIDLQNEMNVSRGHINLSLHTNKTLKKEKPLRLTTNDGRFVQYNFEKLSKTTFVLRSVESSDNPRIKYVYTSSYRGNVSSNLIKEKHLPDDRVLSVNYYKYNHNIVMTEDVNLIGNSGDLRIDRVKNLWAPSGSDSTLGPIYQFIYDLYVTANAEGLQEVQHGSCNVYNALGYRTQYGFNQDHRLHCINKFSSNGALYTSERLFWGENFTNDHTCLLTRDLVFNGSTVFARNYQYDNRGNILVDTLYGNLTGHNPIAPIPRENGHMLVNGCDYYSKHQTYSDDGLNLLLRETEGEKTTRYYYAPVTNRLVGKHIGTESKCLRRYYYFYNEDAAIVKEISDDGSQIDYNDLTNVTERKITYYTQSKTYPVAFPLVIEEKCLDLETGQEKLIHKVVNTYTNLAKIKKQDHYDSNGNYAYSLIWDYDKKGNVIKEVNAIGQITTRKYDANKNCYFEHPGNSHTDRNLTYDYMNRLICVHEVFPDSQNRTTTHRYDLTGNRIATVDPDGNETQFKYDAFGRVIETIYPPVRNEANEVCVPVTKNEYNAMSKVIKQTDARGIETLMDYTIRGQLAKVVYPDGTTETNTYYLNGLLKESKARNNSVTKYAYDPLGRPLSTEVYDENGELLSTASLTYVGSRLISETDPAGIVTLYTYYPDGKIKTKQNGESITTIVYDPLGREHSVTEQYGPENEDVIVKITDYDLLNRVKAETHQDGLGTIISKVEYAYDIYGNVCETTTHNQSGSNTFKKHYDCHNALYSITDAEGHQTIVRNFFDHRNDLGQIVPYQETTDPKGNISIAVCNVMGKVVQNIKKNPFGKITQKQERLYDLSGNMCSIIDTVITDGEEDHEVRSIMHYDSCNRLKACLEAYGTPLQKLTKISYNDCGQKEILTKNDGVSLHHTYDGLGQLKSIRSSDDTVHYIYEYDPIGNPTVVRDEIHGISTVRKYNQHGFMIREELGNELSLTYQHDRAGRTNKVILPDNTAIE